MKDYWDSEMNARGLSLNWTKVGLKDVDPVVQDRLRGDGLNWTKVGLKVRSRTLQLPRIPLFELD